MGLQLWNAVGHLEINTYQGKDGTDWTILSRRNLSWGAGGLDPGQPGWRFRVRV